MKNTTWRTMRVPTFGMVCAVRTWSIDYDVTNFILMSLMTSDFLMRVTLYPTERTTTVSSPTWMPQLGCWVTDSPKSSSTQISLSPPWGEFPVNKHFPQCLFQLISTGKEQFLPSSLHPLLHPFRHPLLHKKSVHKHSLSLIQFSDTSHTVEGRK